jgi:hypothetical protein
MDKEQIREEELAGMHDRLQHEASLLEEAMNARGDHVTKEYSDKVIRAQLETMAEVIESMSQHVGEGEAVSITTPSQLTEEVSTE